ncbi:MAG: 4'-phosphopantetheinyl transferase superfamily protein [Acinetobacter sp.]
MPNIEITSAYFSDLGVIQYHQIQLNSIELHKIDIQLDHQQDLLVLYQKFNIHIPENIKNACFKRKNEFFIGRLAAQYALKSLNHPHNFILHKGQHGEPIWPNNHFGSLSHSMHCPNTGTAIACVNREKYVGIDIELKPNQQMLHDNQDMLNHFLSAFELKYLFNFKQFEQYLYLIVFSAKESTIKAVYSKYKIMLSFLEIQLMTIDCVKNTICFHIHTARINLKITAHYVFLENEIFTYSLI